jgi:hypothetical protein
LISYIATSTHKTPCAKCWAQSLAASQHKPADLNKWGTKVFVNLSPTRMFEVEQCAQPNINSRRNVRK